MAARVSAADDLTESGARDWLLGGSLARDPEKIRASSFFVPPPLQVALGELCPDAVVPNKRIEMLPSGEERWPGQPRVKKTGWGFFLVFMLFFFFFSLANRRVESVRQGAKRISRKKFQSI